MKPRILAITGSLRSDSSNQKIVKKLEELLHPDFTFSYFNGLTNLPYFIPDQAFENTPEKVRLFREEIQYADIVLIVLGIYFQYSGSTEKCTGMVCRNRHIQPETCCINYSFCLRGKGTERVTPYYENFGCKIF